MPDKPKALPDTVAMKSNMKRLQHKFGKAMRHGRIPVKNVNDLMSADRDLNKARGK